MPPKPAVAQPIKTPASQIAILFLSRLLLYSARRFAYPFSPALSRGLGVPLQSITLLISTSSAATLLGPFFGPIADRYGYRRMIVASLSMLAVAMLMGFFAFFPLMFLAFFLLGLSRGTLDPAVQAYVGDRVPYARRGMYIGLLELSFAGSALIGIPLMAVAIDHHGWRSPFLILSLGAMAAAIAVRRSLDYDGKPAPRSAGSGLYGGMWRQVIRTRSSAGMIGFSFFTCMANENLFVVFGPWLESDFGLSVVALGLGTTAIGGAELCGSTLSAFFSDRIGLKRGIYWGQIVTLACYALLPLLTLNLSTALAGVFLVFFSFEFTVVTAISLSTELLPGQRATMMACQMAAAGMGRTVGALTGIPLWLGFGIQGTTWASMLFCALGLGSLLWGLRHWGKEVGQ